MDRITDQILFIILGALATMVRVFHQLYKTGKIDVLKAISRMVVGCVLAGLVGYAIPTGYAFRGLTVKQTTAMTAFLVGGLGIEIVDFMLSQNINTFISIILKKGPGSPDSQSKS